ncbi:CHAT domain-containing protein [Fusarium solani]|uniref:CHAT domain-containing protein n=1 Tax=Fusarium solani TaxID=169388 RepID=A0A9P9G4M7_FUSSL|nr:CHAT domain-containing protein [Fusarium solani]KAH7232458.1 CHAT domain-containing protein [Fusarium solani]
MAQTAVGMAQENDPNWAGRVNNLAVMLQGRYERTGNVADLEEAIDVARQAVAATPDDHPDRAACLSNLGTKLESRYGRTGAMADLEEAIDVARQAVAATPDDHPDRAACLSNLGTKLESRYGRTGAMADLEEAISVARQAVAATPDDHPNRAACLSNLGVMLQGRYERTENVADLEEAISVARQAVAATPDDHPNRAACLSNLGVTLQSRYERTGNVADLEEAISVARQAVAATPDDHPDRAGNLNNLGNKLDRRYGRTGAMADLEEAISIARQAVAATPDDHPNRAAWLNNLGTKLESRYERTGAMADLEEAIVVARQAIAATPDDHPNRAAYLSNLGNELDRRYGRTGAMADLEEAIDVARQAVAAMPDDHPNRAGSLNDLGNKIESRHERTGAMVDLEEAISVARQAVAATPDDHPNRAAWLNNLGTKLESRYECTGAMADLEEAIVVARQAVDATPDDHPDRAAYLSNLGTKLGSRYGRTGAMADLDDASTYLQKAWNMTMAVPFRRIKAAAWCIKLLATQRNVDVAIQLGKDALHLLPTVNTKLLGRNDQQYVVSTFAGVAADLCALLLASNKLDDALHSLEQGRAIILSQLIDGRSDVSDLAEKHPDLARRYEELRQEVNAPLRGLEQDAAREQALWRRRQSILDLDTCISKIRTVPGHDRFLLGQTTAEMKECAVGGSIVIVNISMLQSDAIIITPATVQAVGLSKLTASDAKAWLSKDWTGRRAERAAKNRDYLAYLAWLWKSCVKQILDEVRALRGPSGNDLLRVWWIGSGLASSMPFHAAGIHRADSTETAYHRAVSSYAPSIKALAHARKRAKDSETTHGSLLVVSMSTTPAEEGQKAPPSLPGVTLEKESVLGVTKGRLLAQHMEQPSVSQVLEGLRHCSVAHFACHGSSDHMDPSKSGLILQRQRDVQGDEEGKENDGGAGPVQDRLTVGRISEITLRHARLAYLSACSTAQNKAERLSDEVIHVVSGFLVAGFPHVVGCLWPSNDRVCVEVASGFYSSLFGQGESRWQDEQTAAALRETVMKVRVGDMEMPLNWAQYVHYGP